MKKYNIGIVICNWNTNGLLRACVESINISDRQCFDQFELVVVDNDSSDTSINFIDEVNFDFPITLIRNKSNLGFGSACNMGANWLLKNNQCLDFILFLNPDTKLETTTFMSIFEENQIPDDAGIIGIQLYDDDGNVSVSCSRFPSTVNYVGRSLGLHKVFPNLVFFNQHMREFNHNQDRYVDQVMGAFFLVKMPVIRELHGFDERFFVYFEEVDFCYRASKIGFRTFFLSTSKAYHACGGSSRNVKSSRLYYSLSSRFKYFRKNHSYASYFLVVVFAFSFELMARIGACIVKVDMKSLFEVIRAYSRFSYGLK